MFRSVPVMATDPRSATEQAARTLLLTLAELPQPPGELRVADAAGDLACLILVWPASRAMPMAGAERRRRRGSGKRAGCKEDIVAAVGAAGRPLTRKEVIKALRQAGRDHGQGTVAKALADLTGAGELVNPGDKRGYRLPGWAKPDAGPSLF